MAQISRKETRLFHNFMLFLPYQNFWFKAMKHSPTPPTYYWYCQLIGWTVYTLISLGFLTLSGSYRFRLMLFYTLVSVTGFGFTHVYRSFIHCQGWLRLNLRQIALRIFPTSILIGIAWFVTNSLMWQILGIFIHMATPMNPALAFGIIFNTSVVTFIWSLIYFGWHFFKNYKQAEIDKWKMASMAQEAQLMALKSQINPHFMFNALNNIRALILEDPQKARTMLTSLSELMRYSLRYSHAQKVSLEDELYIVDSYLQLASIQFEDRLKFSQQIDPLLMEIQIPPMLIQILIENSIKHGIAKLPAGGEISLKGFKEDGQTKLIVENTGTLGPANEEESTGTGLQNALERLKMLYGKQAGIQLSNETNQVRATVTIPSNL